MKRLACILLVALTGCAVPPATAPLTTEQISEDVSNVIRLKAQLSSNAAALLPPVPKASAIILPPKIDTNAPIPLPFTWSWSGGGVTSPDGGYLLGWGSNSGVYLYYTNTPSNTVTIAVTNSDSFYWHFVVGAINGGVTSAWSREARFPQWPPNMVKLSWDQFAPVSIFAYSNALWSLVANVTNTNYFLRLNTSTNAVWFRITTSNPPPVNLRMRAFYDYRVY